MRKTAVQKPICNISPFFRRLTVLRPAPTGQSEWLLAAAAGFVIYAVLGLEKFITGRFLHRAERG